MKPEELLERHYQVVTRLSSLPRKMVQIHGKENLTEFVLHELCHEKCFNFNKAAYIINNPHFDCIKGVAGVSREHSVDDHDIWQACDHFSSHMEKSDFNRRVRSLSGRSLKSDAELQKDIIAQFALDLGFKSHNFSTWDMKHDNQGFLVYESIHNDDEVIDQHLMNSLSLLSFCPIF